MSTQPDTHSEQVSETPINREAYESTREQRNITEISKLERIYREVGFGSNNQEYFSQYTTRLEQLKRSMAETPDDKTDDRIALDGIFTQQTAACLVAQEQLMQFFETADGIQLTESERESARKFTQGALLRTYEINDILNFGTKAELTERLSTRDIELSFSLHAQYEVQKGLEFLANEGLEEDFEGATFRVERDSNGKIVRVNFDNFELKNSNQETTAILTKTVEFQEGTPVVGDLDLYDEKGELTENARKVISSNAALVEATKATIAFGEEAFGMTRDQVAQEVLRLRTSPSDEFEDARRWVDNVSANRPEDRLGWYLWTTANATWQVTQESKAYGSQDPEAIARLGAATQEGVVVGAGLVRTQPATQYLNPGKAADVARNAELMKVAVRELSFDSRTKVRSEQVKQVEKITRELQEESQRGLAMEVSDEGKTLPETREAYWREILTDHVMASLDVAYEVGSEQQEEVRAILDTMIGKAGGFYLQEVELETGEKVHIFDPQTGQFNPEAMAAYKKAHSRAGEPAREHLGDMVKLLSKDEVEDTEIYEVVDNAGLLDIVPTVLHKLHSFGLAEESAIQETATNIKALGLHENQGLFYGVFLYLVQSAGDDYFRKKIMERKVEEIASGNSPLKVGQNTQLIPDPQKEMVIDIANRMAAATWKAGQGHRAVQEGKPDRLQRSVYANYDDLKLARAAEYSDTEFEAERQRAGLKRFIQSESFQRFLDEANISLDVNLLDSKFEYLTPEVFKVLDIVGEMQKDLMQVQKL